jgi:hypothetical protein
MNPEGEKMGNIRHEDWREQVERFQESGMTQQRWCDTTGTNLHNLRYWVRKARGGEKTASLHEQAVTWMPLQIIEGPFNLASQPANDGRIIIRIGEASIEVAPGFQSQHLLQVLQTVRAL